MDTVRVIFPNVTLNMLHIFRRRISSSVVGVVNSGLNTRAASSQASPRGLDAVLQKNPDDVVITFAKRTALGRARKGQFKDIPVDEMLTAMLKVTFPQLIMGE